MIDISEDITNNEDAENVLVITIDTVQSLKGKFTDGELIILYGIEAVQGAK